MIVVFCILLVLMQLTMRIERFRSGSEKMEMEPSRACAVGFL
jgi:hypothetical protein